MAETLYINKARVDGHFASRPRLTGSGATGPEQRAQALLQDVEMDGLPKATAQSTQGSYVKAEGAAWLLEPKTKDKDIPAGIGVHSATISKLLDERWRQAKKRIEGGKEDTYWLLVLSDHGQLVAAAVVDKLHILDNVWSSYFSSSRWAAFGTLERVVEEIPMLTVIYAWFLPGGQDP
jgi:hypothetical protein